MEKVETYRLDRCNEKKLYLELQLHRFGTKRIYVIKACVCMKIFCIYFGPVRACLESLSKDKRVSRKIFFSRMCR